MAIQKIKHQVSSKSRRTSSEDVESRWWTAPAEKVGQSMWNTVSKIDGAHGPRHLQDDLYLSLYEGILPFWAGDTAATPPGMRVASYGDLGGLRVTRNLVKSVVDSAAALVSKNIAELRVITSGGTWKQQQKARKLTKYLSGGFAMMGYHAAKQRMFLDGSLTRMGAIKFYKDLAYGKIRCKRVSPHVLLWNDLEGSEPRNLYEYDCLPRESVRAMFPDKSREIDDAPTTSLKSSVIWRRDIAGLAEVADMIKIAEAWHLPSGPKTPGHHVVALENGTVLVDEPWKHEFFPFAFFSWDDSQVGFGGEPLAKHLAGYQVQMGRKLRLRQKGIERACLPRVFVEEGSEVIDDHLQQNEIMGIVRYRGTQPMIATANAFPAEFHQEIAWIEEKAFAEGGISLLMAQGTKPAGIDSGIGIREYNDITATRQVLKGQRLERADEQAGRVFIALSKEMYEDNPKMQVLAPGTKFIETIPWSEVDMEEDSYILRSFPVSALPTHAVGRIQTVVDMIQGGLIPENEAKAGLGLKLINLPDLEKEVTLRTANQELAEMQADSALYEGEYIGPEPFQDLVLLRDTAQKTYMLALQMKGVPDRNLRYLERLIAEAEAQRALVAPSVQPQQPMGEQGAAGAQPMGGPPGGAAQGFEGLPNPAPPVPSIPSAASPMGAA